MKVNNCQSPKCHYQIHDFSVCTEPNDFDPLIKENVEDIADTMSEVSNTIRVLIIPINPITSNR